MGTRCRGTGTRRKARRGRCTRGGGKVSSRSRGRKLRGGTIWKNGSENHVSLTRTGTEGENRGHALKLNDSPKPFVLEKTFVKRFFPWLVRSHEARGVERHEVGASDEGGGLADGPPLVVRNRLAVLATDIATQWGSRLVARRYIHCGVVVAVVASPQYAQRKLRRTIDRPGKGKGTQ